MSDALTNMAKDVLDIHFQFPYCLDHPTEYNADNFDILAFTQTWANTGVGFDESLTGQIVTGGRVYVFIPTAAEEDIHVFFNGKWAYKVPYDGDKRSVFIKDAYEKQVEGVSRAKAKYGAITKKRG